MERVSINDEILKDIANSIRSKTGSSSLMYPQDMSNNIDGITVVNNQSKIVNITNNGTQTVTPDSDYTGLSSVEINTNISVDFSQYFSQIIPLSPSYQTAGRFTSTVIKLPYQLTFASGITKATNFFNGSINLIETPYFTNFNVITDMSSFCFSCVNLETINQLDTQNVTNISNAFSQCTALKNIPVFNLSHATNLTEMFSMCTNLTNDSINNLLASLTSATSFTGTKTLRAVGFDSSYSSIYPASMIQGLSNYNAFVAAGWSIGWS